jgi:excinuclease UvrABC nuclease subunit
VRPHALYRFFGIDGSLLYVGITSMLLTRLGRHGEDKPWWTAVARVDVQHFGSRREALQAEEEAIKAEHPRYNVQHNGEAGADREQPVSTQRPTPKQVRERAAERQRRARNVYREK